MHLVLMRRLSAERRLALTSEPPAARDNPPTLLDNPRALRGGEGLVEFYTTPAYRLWDPSESVFFAFALFFGMILSDAGYAAILGVILLAKWRRMGRTASGRSLRGVFAAGSFRSFGVWWGHVSGWDRWRLVAALLHVMFHVNG
jgi:V/A-type H+-transporting ATPase subunit I